MKIARIDFDNLLPCQLFLLILVIFKRTRNNAPFLRRSRGSPLDYLNRIRVAKALDCLQNEDISITDVAASVGIPDPNYFTRIFKKIMGHAPHPPITD